MIVIGGWGYSNQKPIMIMVEWGGVAGPVRGGG
jgi:hypothetical protein